MISRQPGPWLFALGMTGLGVIQIAFQACLPGLKPLPAGWDANGPMAIVMGAVLVLGGVGLLLDASRRWAGLVLAAFWLGWLLAGHVTGLMGAPANASLWVSATQVMTFAAVGAMLSDRFTHGCRLARIVLGLTLLLFGAVHWLYPGTIVGMISGWVPVATFWPWVTGAIQIAAGLMILIGFRAALAAFVVGLMWLSWVFVIHIPRLLAAPGDLFEWTFMLTAVTLAGAAWSVREHFPRANPA